jgi:ligand-binding sensor domain-containing protein
VEVNAIIIAMCQTKDGNIWLGTYGDGLYCYNPRTGTAIRFINDPEDPESLSDNIIWKIVEDNKGMLWIGTGQGGHCKYDKR